MEESELVRDFDERKACVKYGCKVILLTVKNRGSRLNDRI